MVGDSGGNGILAADPVVQEKEPEHVDVRILYHCMAETIVKDNQWTLPRVISDHVRVSIRLSYSLIL